MTKFTAEFIRFITADDEGRCTEILVSLPGGDPFTVSSSYFLSFSASIKYILLI
jgi:hypothetical protein